MRGKKFWMTRTAGGAVAGVVMAGAGFGVAVAGASGSSNQYTKGATPYAGQARAVKGAAKTAAAALAREPHNVTVGTQTFPSTVTTTVQPVTVTQPYPYVPPATTTELQQLQNEVAALNSANQAANSVNTTLLKGDLRNLLEPTGNYLESATLARAKAVSFKFTSPGSGKLNVAWKIGLPGHKGTYYVNYGGALRKSGAIIVRLPATGSGRTAFAKAKNRRFNVIASVTYTATSGAKVHVGRNWKTIG